MAAPAFDPDAYLAAPPAFDPDAYLAGKKTSLVDQIPGMPPVAAPAPAPSLYQRALGAAEVVPGLLSAAVSGVVAPIAGMAGALTSGQFGTQAGVQAGERAMRRTQEAIGYRPVTQLGAENIRAVGEALAPLVGVPIPTMNALARTAGAPLNLATNALRGEAQLVGGAVSDLAKSRAAATQLAREAKSYANATQIDAAQIGTRLKLAADPSVSNPTASTRVLSALAGPKLSADLSASNVARVKQLVREDLAAPEGKITPDTINTALDNASKDSYDVVRKLPTLAVPPQAEQALRSIPKPALIGGDAAAAEVGLLVDGALAKLSAGRDGALVLDDIRQLRSEANATLKAADIGTSPPKPTEMARARAQMQIADILESVIDANAPKKVLPALIAGRTRMAQIYEHQRAFDFAGQTFDPRAYIKMYNERQGNMTGLGADIAQFAAAYPAVMTDMAAKGYLLPRIVRGSLGATAGGAIGALTANPVGIGAGMAAGIAAERGLGNLVTRKMTNPAFQAKYAVPQDFRRPAPVNTLQPTSNLPVPYVSQGPVVQPGDYPNWVPGRATVDPNIQPSMPQGPAQLPSPSAEATMRNVGQQRAYELARDRAAAAQAEQTAAGQEVAGRQPTGRGTLYDLDPVTGRLKPVSEGMKGATPDVIASTGFPLSAAVEKVSSGRSFALSAEERLAWNKAKVDLATVEPDFNTLSDKAILGKMQDREWVAAAVTKAREKAAAYEQRAQRTDDPQKMRDAAKSRDEMLDIAESLEQRLRGARPVAKATQGPKTREALRERNALRVTPEDNLNNLGR